MGLHHMPRGTFSVGPFLWVFVLLCLVGFFPVSMLGAGGVPGARSTPGSGQWVCSSARLMSPSLQPMAVTSWPMARDIHARIQHLAVWGAPEQSGVCWWGAGCPRQDRLSAQPQVLLLERPPKRGCAGSPSHGRAVRKPSPSSICLVP